MYLGHKIDATRIHPTEDKVHTVQGNTTGCHTVKSLCGINKLLWQICLTGCSTHVAPLYKLLEEDNKRAWTKECDTVSKTCKDL